MPGWVALCRWLNICWRRSLGTCGGVANKVQIANFLWDDLQSWAGTECLYLGAEDLAKGHVLEVEGGPVSNGYDDRDGPSGDACGQVGECVNHDVRRS
jgi:hypothetical protein